MEMSDGLQNNIGHSQFYESHQKQIDQMLIRSTFHINFRMVFAQCKNQSKISFQCVCVRVPMQSMKMLLMVDFWI